jgi:hypothetical protein
MYYLCNNINIEMSEENKQENLSKPEKSVIDKELLK